MQLILDAMLGSLARRARLMGVDVLYVKDETDGEIVKLAHDTGRCVVTRDRQLADRTSPQSLLIETTDPEEGWRFLLEWMMDNGVKLDAGSRCSICNTVLVLAEEVPEGVPENVVDRGERIWGCISCGRSYWRGSHWPGICAHGPDGGGKH